MNATKAFALESGLTDDVAGTGGDVHNPSALECLVLASAVKSSRRSRRLRISISKSLCWLSNFPSIRRMVASFSSSSFVSPWSRPNASKRRKSCTLRSSSASAKDGPPSVGMAVEAFLIFLASPDVWLAASSAGSPSVLEDEAVKVNTSVAKPLG